MTDRPRHLDAAEEANAKNAALPKEERLSTEAANAPYLRIQLAYALQRAEDAEAKTGPTDALEQRLAAMEKLAAAWQKEAERARKDSAVPADMADVAEMRIWDALERPLTMEEVAEHIKILRSSRLLAAEALHVCADTWNDAKKRLTALHAPVQHMGRTWCAECSVRRRTGPKTDEWVAFIPHPCPTIDAFENKEPSA
ncbi:hypothetical protein [Streptomyces osmaniensis]|uniref:DUF222 domain-containing protein n=1 Tax=Streptomyces osmaniensis TaxID=593134 RepID=A0ABP6YX24_9ACTN